MTADRFARRARAGRGAAVLCRRRRRRRRRARATRTAQAARRSARGLARATRRQRPTAAPRRCATQVAPVIAALRSTWCGAFPTSGYCGQRAVAGGAALADALYRAVRRRRGPRSRVATATGGWRREYPTSSLVKQASASRRARQRLRGAAMAAARSPIAARSAGRRRRIGSGSAAPRRPRSARR